MNATTQFSLRSAAGSEPTAKTPDRSLKEYILRRIAIRGSLIGLALGFLVFGTLIIVNGNQADFHDVPGGNCIAVLGGIGAVLVGTVFLVATYLHWRLCTKGVRRCSSFK